MNNDQRMKATPEDFLVSIFEGCKLIFGPSLGGKIRQESMSKRIEKMTTVKERSRTEIFDFRIVLGGRWGGMSP